MTTYNIDVSTPTRNTGDRLIREAASVEEAREIGQAWIDDHPKLGYTNIDVEVRA